MADNWTLTITVAGVDISDKLTGQVVIDAEESQARIAQFSYLHQGTIDIASLVGQDVVIKATYDASENTYFTGKVDDGDIDLSKAIISLRCTDDLKTSVEGYTHNALYNMIKSTYSIDIFRQDQSKWDYAKDILTTVPKALDKTMSGELKATPWAAKDNADWQLTADDLIDQTPDIEYAHWQDIINHVQIDFDYRYDRTYERAISVGWQYPGGFNAYIKNSSALVNQQMLESALNGLDWEIDNIKTNPLPPSGKYTVDGVDHYLRNTHHPNLLLGFSARLKKFWAQTITESFQIDVTAASNYPKRKQIISDTLIADNIPEIAKSPTGSKVTALQKSSKTATEKSRINVGKATPPQGQLNKNGDRYFYKEPPTAWNILHNLQLKARVLILQSHRKNTITFTTPLKAIDLQHTVKMDINTATLALAAQGKVVATSSVWNIATGTALTTVRLAISQAADGVEGLISPDKKSLTGLVRPDTTAYFNDVKQHKKTYNLPTQLGVKDGVDYDESMTGFSGNYSVGDGDFPWRLKIELEGVQDELRNSHNSENQQGLETKIPVDNLSIRLGADNE